MKVMYSCGLCGALDVQVEVRVRGANEDVVAWMQNAVTPALVQHHELASPGCRPKAFDNVKIPVGKGKDARIGDDPNREG